MNNHIGRSQEAMSLQELETTDLGNVLKEVKKREAETWVMSDTLT